MGKGHTLLERLTEEADLGTEPLPGQSIVEIAGDHRVLIENHFGVKAYNRDKILVKVSFGSVCVCGCGLEVMRMTKAQLVIRGRIDGVTLQRRG